MDRDKRYERNKIAFEGFVKGIGEKVEMENLVKVRTCVSVCYYQTINLSLAIRKWRRDTRQVEMPSRQMSS